MSRLVIVAPTLDAATRVARHRALAPDAWVWAATNAVASRWIVRASQRGVDLQRLPVSADRPDMVVVNPGSAVAA